jgi:drug/metabolite transporter (DMT)-like permease
MLTRKQTWALLALTLMWGVNWPMMKLSLQELTPLYFRAITMTLGAAWLFVYFQAKGMNMWPQGTQWRSIVWLGIPNILGWHTMSIMGVQELASGRAAILGFAMPIYTVLLGALLFKQPLSKRVCVAVLCVGVTIGLLLWHELQQISGSPSGVLWMEAAAMSWALGTLLMRRAHFTMAAEALTVWMLLLASLCIWVLAATLEPVPAPAQFSLAMWASLAYGVVFNYGYAQIIWFGMARNLPPATSAMSVMAVPLVGTLSATLIVGEWPHWQDYAALVFGMAAIAAVLLPARRRAA